MEKFGTWRDFREWKKGLNWKGKECEFPTVYLFYEENDVFMVREIEWEEEREEYVGNEEWKRRLGVALLGDEGFFKRWGTEELGRLLKPYSGKSMDEVRKAMDGKKSEREWKQEWEKKKKEEWKELWEKFNGLVIGVDKEIDFYDDKSGFSVRVLFKSDSSFEERKKFLEGNRKEFLLWVMKEVQKMKKVGDVNYYKPVEMGLLRSCEVDVKFELKRGI